MKAKDIFGIILRCVALWITVWGAWQLLAAVTLIPSTITALYTSNTTSGITSFGYFTYGFPAFVGGLLVLAFADTLVGLTYRKPPE